MKRIPPIKPKTAVHTKQYNSEKHRREFSKGLALGLILLAACIVLTTSFLYGQEGDDALFIDKDGNVAVGKKLDVKKDLSAGGTVNAKKFEGDGSAITVGGVEFVKQVKGSTPVTLEEIVRAVIADMVPIGTIMAYGGDVKNQEIRKKLAAQGWLACDGTLYGVNGYPELYGVIGKAFGFRIVEKKTKDGNTEKKEHFHVPDMQGRFLRGVDHGTGRDPDANKRMHSKEGGNTGNMVGSVQEDQFKKHSGHLDYRVYQWTATRALTSGADVARLVNNIDPGGSAETRPKNIYVNWIIKAKHIIRTQQ